jgi:hypothetical protein
LIAAALVSSERRLEGSFKALQPQPRAKDNPVLAKMLEYAGRTHWMALQNFAQASALSLWIVPIARFCCP